MKKTIISLIGAAMVAVVLTPRTSEAQSASINATATVAGALTVTNVRDLGFGTVIPGFNRTILTTDGTSGHFQVGGGANAEVQLSYSALPATLDDGLGNSMNVSFTATHNTTDAGGTGTGFVPSAGLTTRLDAATGELHIYMGGTLTVPAGQAVGVYSGTITLDAAYTGN